jgi:dihydroorotate dehydrogenase (NAD+) catalytic subunit
MGGIWTGRDALEFIAAGASSYALGTALFADPGAPARVRRELEDAAMSLGLADPSLARGLAHEPDLQYLPPGLTTIKTPAFLAN